MKLLSVSNFAPFCKDLAVNEAGCSLMARFASFYRNPTTENLLENLSGKMPDSDWDIRTSLLRTGLSKRGAL